MPRICVAILCALAFAPAATAAETPLICFGNEPSWSVDLTTRDTARFMAPGEEPTSYRGSGTRDPLLKEEIWRGTSAAGRDLVVFLREAACSDNMSDIAHPVIARVSPPDGRFLAGCCRIPQAAGAAAATKTLEGTTWRLTGLTGSDPRLLSGSTRPVTARFAAGRVAGFSGCNRFTGSYTVAGDRVTLGQLAGTMMACPEPAMALENAFRAAFSGTARYAIAGEALDLTAESGAVLAFTAEPAPRLEGVTWNVTGFNNNRQAVVSPTAGTRITLAFGDGMASGNAGCNAFRAPYSSEGDRIKIGPAATTRKACAEALMAQERAFLAALGSAATWTVEAGVLDMHRADGERAITANAGK